MTSPRIRKFLKPVNMQLLPSKMANDVRPLGPRTPLSCALRQTTARDSVPLSPVTKAFGAGTSLLMALGLYVLIICLVAAVLYVAVEAYEPNRRLASSLKRVIVAVAVAAILGHLAR
jgi:hypothetical protein